MARNDVTHALKEVAEKKLGKPVRCVLQRGGSSQKRMFLVVFEDGEKTMAHLPKAPRKTMDRKRLLPDPRKQSNAQRRDTIDAIYSYFNALCCLEYDKPGVASRDAFDCTTLLGAATQAQGRIYDCRDHLILRANADKLARTVNSDSPDSKAEGEGAK